MTIDTYRRAMRWSVYGRLDMKDARNIRVYDGDPDHPLRLVIPEPIWWRTLVIRWLRETFGDVRKATGERAIYLQTGEGAEALDLEDMTHRLAEALDSWTTGITDPETIGCGVRLFLTAENVEHKARGARGNARYSKRYRTREDSDIWRYLADLILSARHGLSERRSTPTGTREPRRALSAKEKRERSAAAAARYRRERKAGYARHAGEWLDAELETEIEADPDALNAAALYADYLEAFRSDRDNVTRDLVEAFLPEHARDLSPSEAADYVWDLEISLPTRQAFYAALEHALAEYFGTRPEIVAGCAFRRGKAKARTYALAEIVRRAEISRTEDDRERLRVA